MKHEDDELVLLAHAPNRAIADVWISLLEAKGIQAYAPGKYLADEWASFRQLTGGVGCDVQVPRSRLAEAKQILSHHSEADDESDEGSDEPMDPLDEDDEPESDER